ncbi:pentapeptide repeat-containing protein [Deinococcus alpinitundrae]|uniref:pentapeptide repeat-containing protein n=1 Tax=Deinococcus alpinitundrae TaxID=468913 RepID=UPI001379CFF0|nr:pentapeptide repeat-containing protein [Deinococcus alpinitundrae]
MVHSQVQSQVSEANARFSSAITLLSSENFNSRLGGVFVPGSLTRTSSDNAFAASQVLAAYLRQQHAVTAQIKAAAYVPSNAAEAVQAALVGLANRSDLTRPLSLAGVSARNAQMSGETIENLNFRSADLTGVHLEGSTLSGIQFTGTQLTRANFKNAVLKDVDFSQAQVAGANFSRADLRGASHLSADMLAKATVSSSTQQPSSTDSSP